MSSLIRPEIAHRLTPLRPFVPPMLAVLAGLWLAARGGWVYGPLGLAVLGTGIALALIEWRRQRLGPGRTAAPGVVEISEGVLRFWAARGLGGELPLREITEIRLLRLQGQPQWRLRSASGEALLIAVDAQGAGLLADAFAALPGADLGAFVRARQAAARADGPAVQTVWTRPPA